MVEHVVGDSTLVDATRRYQEDDIFNVATPICVELHGERERARRDTLCHPCASDANLPILVAASANSVGGGARSV